MSLDVYLEGPEQEVSCRCSECDHEHTRRTRACFYDANITHNLNRMADAAGIYGYLWQPEALHGVKQAAELIEPLKAGLARLLAEPDRFRALNPENGWGTYEGLVGFVENYLSACMSHPEATVSVSR